MRLDAQIEARDTIALCFERLTDREEYVFFGRAVYGVKFTELAADLNLSKASAWAMYQRALHKMRRQLNKHGLAHFDLRQAEPNRTSWRDDILPRPPPEPKIEAGQQPLWYDPYPCAPFNVRVYGKLELKPPELSDAEWAEVVAWKGDQS